MDGLRELDAQLEMARALMRPRAQQVRDRVGLIGQAQDRWTFQVLEIMDDGCARAGYTQILEADTEDRLECCLVEACLNTGVSELLTAWRGRLISPPDRADRDVPASNTFAMLRGYRNPIGAEGYAR